MENEEFELMYNYIYKNYKKNEIKQAIDGVCNYIANKQIKNYNKKMLAELLTKIAELTPYNAIAWSVRENKKNNKKKKYYGNKRIKNKRKRINKRISRSIIMV